MEQIQLQKQNTKSLKVKRGKLAGTQLPVQNYGENLVYVFRQSMYLPNSEPVESIAPK